MPTAGDYKHEPTGIPCHCLIRRRIRHTTCTRKSCLRKRSSSSCAHHSNNCKSKAVTFNPILCVRNYDANSKSDIDDYESLKFGSSNNVESPSPVQFPRSQITSLASSSKPHRGEPTAGNEITATKHNPDLLNFHKKKKLEERKLLPSFHFETGLSPQSEDSSRYDANEVATSGRRILQDDTSSEDSNYELCEELKEFPKATYYWDSSDESDIEQENPACSWKNEASSTCDHPPRELDYFTGRYNFQPRGVLDDVECRPLLGQCRPEQEERIGWGVHGCGQQSWMENFGQRKVSLKRLHLTSTQGMLKTISVVFFWIGCAFLTALMYIFLFMCSEKEDSGCL